jgi:hypothetical protein
VNRSVFSMGRAGRLKWDSDTVAAPQHGYYSTR